MDNCVNELCDFVWETMNMCVFGKDILNQIGTFQLSNEKNIILREFMVACVRYAWEALICCTLVEYLYVLHQR